MRFPFLLPLGVTSFAALAAQPSSLLARWSSGQDGGLSRRKREFDSPTGHQKKGRKNRGPYAPLAQLVEQLTLNQRAQGSSPWRCTKQKASPFGLAFLFGARSRACRRGGAPEASAACGGCSEPERAAPQPDFTVRALRALRFTSQGHSA